MRQDGVWLKDEEGRSLILRGSNLGGSAKIPFSPDGATWRKEGFYDWQGVSFVGRPFPIEEADEHLSRLARWGNNVLRFLVTWEAIEHDGPGIYDEGYLAYIRKVIKMAGDRGINVFIDPHQDVWSRWTGGDGAPAWTLTKLGIDLEAIHPTCAALVHEEIGPKLPRMIWSTNYSRYAAATMFSLFFAGNDLAPKTTIDGESVQDYLQNHFIQAMRHCYRRLKDLPNIIGFDSLNEPSAGYIGCKDLNQVGSPLIKKGPMPTPFQGMVAAMGHRVEVEKWNVNILGQHLTGKTIVNPEGRRLFREGFECPWKANGVWADEEGQPRLLKPDYFAKRQDREINFSADYLRPFLMKYSSEIRAVREHALIFVESVPNGEELAFEKGELSNIVNATHWYDGATQYLKRYTNFAVFDYIDNKPHYGIGLPPKSFIAQLAWLKARSLERLGEVPVVLGEFGLPFDLNAKRFFRTGNFKLFQKSLGAYYDAIDASLLSSTIWNYSANNSNKHGDEWNDEDFSIFSRDQQKNPADPDSGARGLLGFCRPYAMRTAGRPLSMRFDSRRRRFNYRFLADPEIQVPTEIFVPEAQYQRGFSIELSKGQWEFDEERQIASIHVDSEVAIEVSLEIKPK